MPPAMDLFVDGLIEAIRLIAGWDPLVMEAAWRSLWISIAAAGIAAVFGILIGAWLARRRFFGHSVVVLFFRAGMAVPTVLIGLIGYGLLSRRGPLGGLELLYTPSAIVLGEFFLALPIVVTWTQEAIARLDPRIPETARVLGAGSVRRFATYFSETRTAIALAVLTAFARCFTELGIAMMIGGNIKYRTRTLTTATALETARGEFARGIAMGLILFGMAMLVAAVIGRLGRSKESR